MASINNSKIKNLSSENNHFSHLYPNNTGNPFPVLLGYSKPRGGMNYYSYQNCFHQGLYCNYPNQMISQFTYNTPNEAPIQVQQMNFNQAVFNQYNSYPNISFINNYVSFKQQRVVKEKKAKKNKKVPSKEITNQDFPKSNNVYFDNFKLSKTNHTDINQEHQKESLKGDLYTDINTEDLQKMISCLDLDEEYTQKKSASFKYEMISEKFYNFSSIELKNYISLQENIEKISEYFSTLKNQNKSFEIDSLFHSFKLIYIEMLDNEVACLCLKKLYFILNEDQLLELWYLMTKKIYELCSGKHSNKNVHCLITELTKRNKNNCRIVFKMIEEYLPDLLKTSNGCNLIKKLINIYDENAINNIEAYMFSNFRTICTDKNSFTIILAFIKLFNQTKSYEKNKKIIDYIITDLQFLIIHEIGSKLIAKAINFLGLEVCIKIINYLTSKIHIYASNINCNSIIHVILDYITYDRTEEDLKYSFCLSFLKLKNPQLLKVFSCRRAYNIISKVSSILKPEDIIKLNDILKTFSSHLDFNHTGAQKIIQRINNVMNTKYSYIR